METEMVAGQFEQAVDSLIDAICVHLKEDGDRVDINLAIMVAGSLAGLSLLRNSRLLEAISIDPTAEPTFQSVISEEVNQQGIALLDQMKSYCPRIGLDPEVFSRLQGLSESEGVDFLKNLLELERRLEPVFITIADESQVKPGFRAQVAAYAALKFVKISENFQPAEQGMALAVKAIVYSAKTHPSSSLN